MISLKRARSIFWIVIVFALLNFGDSTAIAKEPEPEPCPTVGITDWGMKVARCEDWEGGSICYLNTSGMMFCLPD